MGKTISSAAIGFGVGVGADSLGTFWIGLEHSVEDNIFWIHSTLGSSFRSLWSSEFKEDLDNHQVGICCQWVGVLLFVV